MTEPAPLTPRELEQTLRELDRIATPVRRRPDRETWRFEFGGRAYFLHFYPADAGGRLSRSAATTEFAALKTLQTLKLPAVRPVALLSGLRFGDRKGDAVVTVAVEPAVRLDEIAAGDHVAARNGVIDFLETLKAAGLGHADLRPSAFLFSEGRVLLADAVGLARGGLTADHLMRFAHAAGDRATVGDRVRAWRRLVQRDAVPPRDRHVVGRFRRDVKALPVERLKIGLWSAHFLAAAEPAEWSAASGLHVTADDWRREWPLLLDAMNADRLDVLKRDASGDVLGGKVTLAGRSIDVIVKRPRNKYWYRHAVDVRPSRAWRTWKKAMQLLVRGVPTERPLAVFERRVATYAAESAIIFERVVGTTLEHVDLAAMPAECRRTLFRRCGRTLRRIEDTGLAHTDAKNSNWIVFESPAAGPLPVLVDLYGVRAMNPWLHAAGVQRLLRAMRKHPQYTPADSLEICLGFAPRATPQADPPEAGDAH